MPKQKPEKEKPIQEYLRKSISYNDNQTPKSKAFSSFIGGGGE